MCWYHIFILIVLISFPWEIYSFCREMPQFSIYGIGTIFCNMFLCISFDLIHNELKLFAFIWKVLCWKFGLFLISTNSIKYKTIGKLQKQLLVTQFKHNISRIQMLKYAKPYRRQLQPCKSFVFRSYMHYKDTR